VLIFVIWHRGALAVTGTDGALSPASPKRSRWKRAAMISLIVVIAYGALAYLILPLFWTHYEHQKGLAALPMVTRTGQDIPGDPINVGLVGDTKDVLCAMHAADWYPADPITLQSSIEIAGSVLLDRPYRDAPVSNLYYLGRREDLAFEKPDGGSADHRHHVRFWKVLDQGEEKRPVWLGDAAFDRSVGVSHYTGAVTHHIDADIDAERQFLATDLEAAGMVQAKYQVTGIGPTLAGATAAAISIIPTAKSGSCGWSRPAKSEQAPPPSFPVRPRPRSRTKSGRGSPVPCENRTAA
jgi:hypothetical protein